MAEPGVARALIAGFGSEVGREAAAEALAYGWQHWDRLEGMENGSRYLVTRCADVGCSSVSTVQVTNPHFTEDQFAQGWIWQGGTISAAIRSGRGALLL